MDARELLIARMRERRVVPFVGAGISTGLCPNWKQLLERLWDGTGDFDALWGERGPAVVAELVAAGKPRAHLAEASARVMDDFSRANPKAEPIRQAHTLVATGPWPAILTTNWDDLLERAFANRGPHLRYASALPVRHRRDARRFYAEVKAGVRPGPLLKLHGDLLLRRDEFVLGHGDYRRVMTRDVELRSLVRWLASEYSLLFFGTSLTDPDVLAWLDETHESLGHAIGPHFWLTADDPDERFDRFLLGSYGIRTLRVPDWADADHLLEQVLRDAGRGAVDDLSLTVALGPLSVTLLSHELPADSRDAVGVSVGVNRRGRPLAGATFRAVYGHDKLPKIEGASPGRAIEWPADSGRWLLLGQEEGAYGRTGYVHASVLDFLRQAARRGFQRAHLPLVAGGGGRLAPHEAFQSELHAIGVFAAEAQAPIEVVVHLPFGPPSTRMLAADLADGRIVPGPILARGRDGMLRVTVIYPTLSADLVALPVLLPREATAGDLRASLVDPAEPTSIVRFQEGEQAFPWDPGRRLEELHVTEGCIVRLVRDAG